MKLIRLFSSIFFLSTLNHQEAIAQAKVYSNYVYDSEGKVVSKIFSVDPEPLQNTQDVIPFKSPTVLDTKKKLQDFLTKQTNNIKPVIKNHNSTQSETSPLSFLSTKESKIDILAIKPKDKEFYIIPDNKGEKLRLKCLTNLNIKWVIFVDEEFTYFVFNQHVDIKFLNIPNISIKEILSKPEIINYPQNTILRVKLQHGVNVQYTVENGIRFLNFSHFESSSWEKDIYERTNPPIDITHSEDGSIIFDNLENGEKQTININNQELTFIFTPNPDKGSYYDNMHRKIFIQPSFQGLCLKILGQNHRIHFDSEKGVLKVQPTLSKVEKATSKSIFEINQKGDFTQERVKLIDVYINNHSKMKIKDIFRLAFIDLQLELGYEAQALLESEAKSKPFLMNNKLYYFYLGMAHFINKEPERAITEWKKIPLLNEEDIWYRMALCELGNPMWCFNQINKVITKLPHLNTGLRHNIGRKAIDFMCKTTNFDFFEPLKKTLKEERNYFIKQWLELLNATDLYFKKNYFASMQVLAQIKKRKEVDFREAKFDTLYKYLEIQNQLEQKNVNQKKLMNQLALIHRTWTSDSFGYHLKKHLANLQDQFKDPRSALHNLKFLKDRFPVESVIDLTDKTIIKILEKYIKNRKQYSPIKVINMFKTFEKIIDLDDNRFTILDEVAKQYIDLNLLKAAIILMKKNLNNIHNNLNQKIDYSIKIAKLYEQLGEPRESITLYDSLLKNQIDLEKHNKILTYKIKTLLHLKEYDQVLQLTENRSDPEFILLKSGVYFEKKEWAKTIGLLEELTLRLDPLHIKSKKVFVRILNNLAFCYFMMQQEVEHKKNEFKKKKKPKNTNYSSSSFTNLNNILKNKYKELLNERKKLNPNDPYSINYFAKLEELGKKYGALMVGQDQFLFLTRTREKNYFSRSSVEKVLSDAKRMEKYFFNKAKIHE